MIKNYLHKLVLMVLLTLAVKLDESSAQCNWMLIDDPSCNCAVELNEIVYFVECDNPLDKSPDIYFNKSVPIWVKINNQFWETLQIFAFNASSLITQLTLNNDSVSNITKGTFAKLPALNNLILTQNKLTTLNGEMFDNLDSLNLLDLSENQIEHMEQSTFGKLANLKTLILRNNQLEFLNDFVFQNLVSLTNLNLKGNRIELIGNRTLYGLSKLEILNLASNRLTILEPQAFNYLIYVTEIYLSDNQLSIIDENTFKDLLFLNNLHLERNILNTINSRSFYNLGLLNIDLSYQKLTDLEINSFASCYSLSEIDLKYNQLKMFKPGFIGTALPGLSRIDVSNNLIETLVSNNFGALTNLEKLNLENNYIKTIEKGAFVKLKNLAELKLNKNLLVSIDVADTFVGLKFLKELQLNENKLSSVQKSSFRYLENLETLLLIGNFIINIEEGAFRYQTLLCTLDLSSNKLTKITGGMFLGLNSLIDLYLDDNLISYIDEGTFDNLESLVGLSLRSNLIQKLTPRMFNRAAQTIEIIDLRSNRIESIDESTFGGLFSLRTIDLANNQIKFIHKRGFFDLQSLESISLSNNPLQNIANGEALRLFENNPQLNQLTFSNISMDPMSILDLRKYDSILLVDFSHNKINIQNSTWIWCDLSNLLQLTLTNTGLVDLKYLKLNKAKKLVKLNLSMNPIDWSAYTSVKQLFEQPLDLVNLNLKHTNLVDLDIIGFSKLTQLEYVDLSFNRIECLKETTFTWRSSKNVTLNRSPFVYLDLSHNRLKFIESNSFASLHNLEHLMLDHNEDLKLADVAYLGKNFLEKLSNLESLNMTNTNLVEFPRFSDSNADYKLVSLDLSHNRMQNLAKTYLNYIKRLVFLDLGFNQIDLIDTGDIFAGLNMLETLILSFNRINDLSHIDFGVLFNVKLVNLSYNLIDYVAGNLFYNMKKLETIDLSYNAIYYIEKSAFNSLPYLKSVYLYSVRNETQTKFTVFEDEFILNCESLKFVYFSWFELIEKNLQSLARTLKPLKYHRKVNEVSYFSAINVILDNHDYYYGAQDHHNVNILSCQITIELLKYKIHLNLFTDYDADMFFQSCFMIDLLSSKTELEQYLDQF